MRFVATKTPSWAGGGRRVRRLHDSDLDWTVVRPPRLTDKPKTGSYRTAYGRNLRRGVLISRGDVADFMLRVLGQPESIKQTIGIAY